MNLWRRSKSWFHEGILGQKSDEVFDPKCYLEHERHLLVQKYEKERRIVTETYHKHLEEIQKRFDSESRQMQQKHSRLIDENESGVTRRERKAENDGGEVRQTMRNSDELEWDPSDDLSSFCEDDASESWDVQSSSTSSSNHDVSEENLPEQQSRDSAYNSFTSFLNSRDSAYYGGAGLPENFEEFRAAIRQEILAECDEKFRKERKFYCSIIDELEENVELLRKQKEDIVSIFEKQSMNEDL